MGNVLETVTIQRYPEIQALKDGMEKMGALKAMMSGSGPTVFGLFDDRRTAGRRTSGCGREAWRSRCISPPFLTDLQ